MRRAAAYRKEGQRRHCRRRACRRPLGVAALQRSLCTSKHMKMAPLQTHPEACAPTFGHSTRRQRGSCRCSPALVSSRLSSSVRVEGDRRRQSCMFKDLGCTKRFSTKNAPVCAHMTHHSFAAHPFRPALPGERQPKFSYVLLLSPCFFDSFLEVTEVGAASFHLPKPEKRKKKLRS